VMNLRFMSFSNRRSFLYLGREKSIHDDRFLGALHEIGQVQARFLNADPEPLTSNSINSDYDLVLACPLTDAVASLPNGVNVPIVGISLAYDINEEITDEVKQIWFGKNLERLESIIVDCRYIEEKLRSSFGFQKDIYRVPFGCDFEYFSDIPLKFTNDLQILVTRNWTKIHGNDVVLAALEQISQVIDFKATFLGSGPELEELSRKHHRLVENGQIRFLGRRKQSELRSHLSDNWCYISGARSDGSSVSLMEAMSAGRVCVVTDFASNLEWVQDNLSGFTFRNGDPADLAGKLIAIAQSPKEKLRDIGDQARGVASSAANWGTNQRSFQDAILKTLAEVG